MIPAVKTVLYGLAGVVGAAAAWSDYVARRARFKELASANGLALKHALLGGATLTGSRGLIEVEVRVRSEGVDGYAENPTDATVRAKLPTPGRLEAFLMPEGASALSLPVTVFPLRAGPALDGEGFRAWGVKPPEAGRDFLLARDLKAVFGSTVTKVAWARFTPERVEFSLAERPAPKKLGRLLDHAAALALAAADV